MKISRNRKEKTLTLSQEYIEKVLEWFAMQNAKLVATPLASHFRLTTKEMCPRTQDEIAYMSSMPYASAVGSLMYAMVWTRPDIAHAVEVVSRYIGKL